MTCFKVKGNVDLLKLIQLGITLFDSGGQLPEGVCTWQVGTCGFWSISNIVNFSSISSLILKPTCTQRNQYHYFR